MNHRQNVRKVEDKYFMPEHLYIKQFKSPNIKGPMLTTKVPGD